jgi:uncharacterized membrane protein
MNTLFSFLLVLHIAGGTAGLIAGSIAASVKKGGKLHRISGKIFFYGMLTASLSALTISWFPGHTSIFLFAVGGFTLYMISSGYSIVFAKRNANRVSPAVTDYLLAAFGFCFGLFLIILSATSIFAKQIFGVVPGVFGLICISFVVLDFRFLRGKQEIKKVWMAIHISRMMGALIASYTAFLVVNIHIRQQWILWLLPTVLGGMLLRYFLQKYAPKKAK